MSSSLLVPSIMDFSDCEISGLNYAYTKGTCQDLSTTGIYRQSSEFGT